MDNVVHMNIRDLELEELSVIHFYKSTIIFIIRCTSHEKGKRCDCRQSDKSLHN
jgi:hypothetical protein